MPKAKGKSRRHKYSYNLNRKRLYRSARRRAAPRIACSHIRHAWDPHKSVAQNLAEMGLAEDPNKAVPIPKKLLIVAWEQATALQRHNGLLSKYKKRQSISWDLPEKGVVGNAAAKFLPIIKKGSFCTVVPAWPICIRGQRFQVKGGPKKLKEKGMEVETDGQQPGKKIVRKPYVVNEMELEASLPEKKSNTLSRDLIDYVRYMIQNHGENYKEMARDEKNYYQDTPKQIKRKINVYKNFYPEEYKNFIASLKPEKMEVQ